MDIKKSLAEQEAIVKKLQADLDKIKDQQKDPKERTPSGKEEAELKRSLERETKKLKALQEQQQKQEKRIRSHPYVAKAMNFAKTTGKYASATFQAASVVYGLGQPAEALKAINLDPRPGITQNKDEERKKNEQADRDNEADAYEQATGRKDAGEEQEKEKAKGKDKATVEQLLKERDKDIKKAMVHEGKKPGEARKEADKKLLEKLNKEHALRDNSKVTKTGYQDEVKKELQKQFGEEGRKKYEEKIQEEIRKREEQQKQYHQKLNQSHQMQRR